MSRIRTIKPEFFKHEGLFDLEQETKLPIRLCFAGLWTQCDRAGRFEWRPRQLKTDISPYDEVDFSRVLDALATRGFIVKYASQGREYGFIPSWNKHQVINNRERDSDLPDPLHLPPEVIVEQTENDASATRQPRVPHATQELQSGRGKEGEREKEEPKPIGLGAKALNDRPLPAEMRTEGTVFAFGKSVLGRTSGGLIVKLRDHCRGDLAALEDLLRQAKEKADPREWVGAVLKGSEAGRTPEHILFPAQAYRGLA